MTQETLPFQGKTPQSRHTGRKAALAAATRRAPLRARYLALLASRWPDGCTDHEAAAALGCPVSSMCSTRSAVLSVLATLGERIGSYGEANTVWGFKGDA